MYVKGIILRYRNYVNIKMCSYGNVKLSNERLEKWQPGPRLNIKTVFPRYGDSHVKDKTVARPSYLLHGDPYAGKTTSLYWDGPLVFETTILVSLWKVRALIYGFHSLKYT